MTYVYEDATAAGARETAPSPELCLTHSTPESTVCELFEPWCEVEKVASRGLDVGDVRSGTGPFPEGIAHVTEEVYIMTKMGW